MFVQNNECGCKGKCTCPKEIFDKPETIILQKGDKGDPGDPGDGFVPEESDDVFSI